MLRIMRPKVVLLSAAIACLFCIPFVSAEDSLSLGASLGVAAGVGSGGSGSAQYEAMTTRAVGIRYSTTLRERWEFEIGATWLATDVRKIHYPFPEGWDRVTTGRIRLLTVPMSLRRRVRDHLSVEYSATVDVDASPGDLDAVVGGSIKSRSGVGLGFGLRVEPGAPRRCRLFANPYLTLHSLLPLGGEGHSPRVWEVGVRVGVRLRLTTPPQPLPRQ